MRLQGLAELAAAQNSEDILAALPPAPNLVDLAVRSFKFSRTRSDFESSNLAGPLFSASTVSKILRFSQSCRFVL